MKGSFPEKVQAVSDWNFRDEVIEFPGPVVTEFFSPGCGYSRQLAPVLEELAWSYTGRIKFVRIDITTNRVVPSQYEITGTPTIIFFKQGRIVNRVTGLLPKAEIERYLDYLLST